MAGVVMATDQAPIKAKAEEKAQVLEESRRQSQRGAGTQIRSDHTD
jgi:hypothetical protein